MAAPLWDRRGRGWGGDLWDVGSGVIHVGPSLTSPRNIKYSCPCRRPSALDSHAGGIDSSALIGCERGQQRLGGGLQRTRFQEV